MKNFFTKFTTKTVRTVGASLPKRLLPLLLAMLLTLAALSPIGCSPKKNPEVTSPETTPSASSPDSTSADSTPDESGAETPPEIDGYSITYDLCGGFNANNPTVYTALDEFTLKAPLRAGYRFVGWTGSGIDGSEPQASVTVKKGTEGDLSYTANWEELGELTPDEGGPAELDRTHFGKDDSTAAADLPPISETVITDDLSRGIHLTNTVYTNIVTDGEMDAAYTYGLHFKMAHIDNNKDYYKDRNTTFDVFMIRGQEGMLHVYIKVVDNDINVPEELWKTASWRTDCIHFYYDYGNTGTDHKAWTLGADGDEAHINADVDELSYKRTDYGFVYEFAFDNSGVPFAEGDGLGFGVYYNDCNEYTDINNYKKSTLKIPSKLNPESSGSYAAPSPSVHDSLLFSLDSATGVIENVESGAEKTGDLLQDAVSGAAKVAVAYASGCSPYTRYQAESIYSELLLGGADVTLLKESEIRKNNPYECIIYVGYTTREETQNTVAALGYDKCGFSLKDGRISVVGWTEENLYEAKQMLFTCFEYARHGGKTAGLDEIYAVHGEGTAGEELPYIENVDIITDAGEGAYCLLIRPATMGEFTKIKTDLSAAGFTLHTENTMNTVLCATYYDETTVVNVTYDSSELNKRDIRVVVEPLSNTTLPATAPETYTPTGTSSVTQVNPNNLTYIIKLDNGEFLVIDSGTNGQPDYIYYNLMELSDDGKPVVLAWIFTHFHQDHIGGFVEFTKNKETYLKEVTVKNIIYNFPEKQVLNTAPGSTDQGNIALWQTCLENTGATVYQARTGQEYYFANAKIEFLFTYEDLMPFFVEIDRTNPTSMIFTVEIAGQKLNFTGDASAEAAMLCVDRYGSYLKADFAQMSHHGSGDGGTPKTFYMNIDAPYVFVPGVRTAGHAETWACENAIEKGGKVFLRDTVGTVTLPLPYDGK